MRIWVLAAALLAAVVPALIANQAVAVSCSGSYGNVGAINQHTPTYGSSMDVYVNNFDSDQYRSWRSETVWQNQHNFAEVGWATSGPDFGDQKAHPYKTRVNNDTQHTILYPGIDISPRDELHTFVVKDTDDDNQYTSSYDGNALGDTWFVSLDPSLSNSQVQSERSCNGDSLWSEYRSLEYFNSQGNTGLPPYRLTPNL